ncbi:uncharacterized protein LOC112081884 [Eutrema salsugineum]|uniref:uncharacterized protein LOC112081884 n=1 Tax=Eutrema salsugineum TaxID=72664 RepID=UPI000CECE683|nr:uncharacterized protein LOC112081884 [Eutrema salsugineum]
MAHQSFDYIAWRLLKFPDTLFARLFKAKYFRDTSILYAKPQKNQSFGWSSILVGLDLIKKGIRFNVGSGSQIKAFSDNWLPSDPPRPARGLSSSTLLVSDLINSTSNIRSWNDEALDEHLEVEDKALAKSLFLSQETECDKVFWHYTNHGEYSIRSGYYLARKLDELSNSMITPPHGDPGLKSKIWKLPILPKFKHFLWRIASKAISTASRLRTRGILLDPTCQRCGREEETINHLLFECPVSNMVWRLANLPITCLYRPSLDCEENIRALVDIQSHQGISDHQKILPFWILWRIWKSRNNFIFNKQIPNPSKDVSQANAEVKEWIEATNSSTSTLVQNFTDDRNCSYPTYWTRPPLGFLKCNVDAAFDQTTKFTSAGWIVRDDLGIARIWGSAHLGLSSSPLEAEGKALLAAIQNSFMMGFRSIILKEIAKL